MSQLLIAANTNRDSILPSLYKGVGSFDSINDLAIVIANIIQILLSLASILAVIYITWAGIQYITSQGDPGKLSTAKTGLTNAVVGLVLSAGAYILVEFFARQL